MTRDASESPTGRREAGVPNLVNLVPVWAEGKRVREFTIDAQDRNPCEPPITLSLPDF